MTIGRKDSNNNMNDNDSETSEHNDYSGFQLIPEHDLDDSDTSSDEESQSNNNSNNNNNERKLTREEEIRRQVELNNKFLFDDDIDDADVQQQQQQQYQQQEFTDFQGYSDQFHQFDEQTDATSDLKVNPNNLLFNTNELFSNDKNDPFNESQQQKEQEEKDKNTSPYCQRNEKGHMVLSKDKLLPPDHVELIRECMKNIKVTPPPYLSDKWKIWDEKLQSKYNNNTNNNDK